MRKKRLRTLTGRKNDFRYLRQGIHRELSGLIPAARHYAMDMRMEMEVLTPTVKHGEEADRRTQMLGICCNR